MLDDWQFPAGTVFVKHFEVALNENDPSSMKRLETRFLICTDGGGFAIDGPTRRGSPHPRGAGSFPRVLGRYVRERKSLPLADAIRKMTSFPASRVRLRDRGTLAPGFAADVVVFDPARVADTATFDSPFQYPVGIELVVVNGAVALRGGERSATGSGRAVRPS